MRAAARAAAVGAAVVATSCGGGDPTPSCSTSSSSSSSCCATPTVVQLFGDSTYAGGALAPMLGLLLYAKYPGRVTLQVVARHGATAADLVDQAAPIAGAIVIAGVGLNDAFLAVPLADFSRTLRGFAPGARLILATPGPMDTSKPYTADDAAYAAAVRQVAAERRAGVADVAAFMLARPDWRRDLVDGVHWSDDLAGAIAAGVILPAIDAALERLDQCR